MQEGRVRRGEMLDGGLAGGDELCRWRVTGSLRYASPWHRMRSRLNPRHVWLSMVSSQAFMTCQVVTCNMISLFARRGRGGGHPRGAPAPLAARERGARRRRRSSPPPPTRGACRRPRPRAARARTPRRGRRGALGAPRRPGGQKPCARVRLPPPPSATRPARRRGGAFTQAARRPRRPAAGARRAARAPPSDSP